MIKVDSKRDRDVWRPFENKHPSTMVVEMDEGETAKPVEYPARLRVLD